MCQKLQCFRIVLIKKLFQKHKHSRGVDFLDEFRADFLDKNPFRNSKYLHKEFKLLLIHDFLGDLILRRQSLLLVIQLVSILVHFFVAFGNNLAVELVERDDLLNDPLFWKVLEDLVIVLIGDLS